MLLYQDRRYEAENVFCILSNVVCLTLQLLVITSKQRPRKICLLGDDGKEYVFLLKGHEDLRLDERVMQLFGLVNTLLANARTAADKDLSIERYAVVPLSPNIGLIGWLPHCDTLHQLIRDYRCLLLPGPPLTVLSLICKGETRELRLI